MTHQMTVIIPARLASTRLPNKALLDIAGLPMIVQVAKRVSRGFGDDVPVVVATDHASIAAVCEQYGIHVVMTRTDHESGTDRLAEASQLLGLAVNDIVVNVQGDEPLIDVSVVREVAKLLQADSQLLMSTAAHPFTSWEEFANPNAVKVVVNQHRMALYFSRAPIPWDRDQFLQGVDSLPHHAAALRHMGLYAYRMSFLQKFPHLEMAPMEKCEALEQLRVLWHGHAIGVYVAKDASGLGVDTLEDLEVVRRRYQEAQGVS